MTFKPYVFSAAICGFVVHPVIGKQWLWHGCRGAQSEPVFDDICPRLPTLPGGDVTVCEPPWIHRQMETLIFSPPPPLYSPRRSRSSCPGEHMCCFKEEVHNRIQRPVLEIWLRAFLLFSQTFFFSGQGWIYCRCSTQQAVTTSWWPVTTLKLKYMQA